MPVKTTLVATNLVFIFSQLVSVPSARKLNLCSFRFDDFSLESDHMLKAAIRMFIDCGFMEAFNIEYEVTQSNYCYLIYCKHQSFFAQSVYEDLFLQKSKG